MKYSLVLLTEYGYFPLMSGNRRWLACWLVGTLSWSSPVVAAPAPAPEIGHARILHAEATTARTDGHFAIAARKFEEAYNSLPDTCSPTALKLLDEADSAYRQAYKGGSGRQQLCHDERMLYGALGDGSCGANNTAISDLLKSLRIQMLNEKVECPPVAPVKRPLDESLPIAVSARRPPPPPPPPPKPAPVLHPAAPRRTASIVGAVFLGVGTAAVAPLFVSAWSSEQTEREIEELLAANVPECSPGSLVGACERLDNQGRTMNRMAIGSGIAAGTLIISGIVLLVAGRRHNPRRTIAGRIGALPGLTWRF
jgi:hypothetical protein